MSLATKRLKVYLRVAVGAAVVLAIALVLYKNRNYRVSFWFFGLTDAEQQTNVIWLLWWTAGVTLIVSRVVWFMRGLLKDMREIRTHKAKELETADHARRVAELNERERRLNEKLAAHAPQDTIGETNDTSAQGGAS